MSKINKFLSVVDSTLGVITSRNFNYKGYWFPGFLARPKCYYRFNLFYHKSENKIENDFNAEVLRILNNQIKLQGLEDHKLLSATFEFANTDDKVYNYYGRRCNKIDLKLELTTAKPSRVYRSIKTLYAEYHNPERELRRIN